MNPIARGLVPAFRLANVAIVSRRACAVLAVGLAATGAWAADDDAARPNRPGVDFQQKLLEEFDADINGQLDETERGKAREAMTQRRRQAGAQGANFRELVKRFDKDGDGRLNEEERQAAMKASRGAAGQRPGGNAAGTALDRGEMIKRFDKDGNGRLDQTELAAAKAAFANRRGAGAARPEGARPEGSPPGRPAAARGGDWKRFDKDGNGKLDDSERAAARAAFESRQDANRRGANDTAPTTPKPDTGRVNKKELLKEFDADGDGQLTGAERAAARKAFEARKAQTAQE